VKIPAIFTQNKAILRGKAHFLHTAPCHTTAKGVQGKPYGKPNID
jgi:hypothetical protein